MPSFKEIQDEIANILDIPTDQMDDEQKAAWDSYANELGRQEASKVDGYGQFRRLQAARADALKAEADRLTSRARSIRNNLDWLDSQCLYAMRQHGLKKVSGDIYSISLRANEVVKITDASVLPPEYVRTKTSVEPDKIAIKEALKQGQEVPGAMMDKSYSIRIA